MLKYTAIALIIGYILDIIIGDPRWMLHPVRIIGKTVELLEKLLRHLFPKTPSGEKTAGFFMVVMVCTLCTLVPAVVIPLCFRIHTAFGIAVMAFICYQFVAVKALKDESMKVYYALRDGTVKDGRAAVSMIVGRDTDSLDEKGIIKATVETVAENFSDGVFAPLFYFILGGPVPMIIYKGINTMDSMVGYKNEKYICFGRYAARLDDAVNYIPSRLAGLFLIAAAGMCRENMRNGWKIFKRDRKNHSSPNSAQTESAVAGAMEIQLAGNAYYFGTLYEKPFIGDSIKEVCINDIRRVNRLMYFAGGLTAAVFAAVHTALCVLICYV